MKKPTHLHPLIVALTLYVPSATFAAPTFSVDQGLASAADPAVIDSASSGALPSSIALRADVASELDALIEKDRTLREKAVAQAGADKAREPASSSTGGDQGIPRSARNDRPLARAKQLVDAGKSLEASTLLFQMSRSVQYEKDWPQIKYALGLMLSELKLYQSAAFVYYDLIRDEAKKRTKTKYLKLALQKLAIAADFLDSDVLLKYAIKQVDENDFPAASRDMLFYRTGELNLFDKKYEEASRLFGRIGRGSAYYNKAKYRQGLAYSELKQTDRAVAAFDELYEANASGPVTNRNRVEASLGKARALYQKQQWDASLEAYRRIPRDVEQWHEALFEESWADVRSARFRSTLSNMQSLHSAFYEDFYQPESLLLRAIVYVYICRFDEMDKVMELYEKTYRPVDRDLRAALMQLSDPSALYAELAKTQSNFEAWRANKAARRGSIIPFIAARKILKEADVRRTFAYLQRLGEERRRIAANPASWQSAGVGRYSAEIVQRRIAATQSLAGKQIRRHMIYLVNDLRDFTEQADLLKLERLSGKRESIKKEIAGKTLVKSKIEEDTQRDYLIQNGYEYWPFKGEYWLDEIGNYHFVGTQACE